MNIKILHLLEGAKESKGLAVVIDVFRAFTVQCYLFAGGAKGIIAVSDIDTAYGIRNKNSSFILIGERDERVPEGFDFGNSPTLIENINFNNKTIIHTTSAGTQGLVNAVNAEERITGSFVNADAIVRYIKQKNPAEVSLVCMGYSMKHPTEEDSLCAEYIKQSLEGRKPDFGKMKEIIKRTSAQRLFDPENQDFSPFTDFEKCMKPGIFDFVIQCKNHDKYPDSLLCRKYDI